VSWAYAYAFRAGDGKGRCDDLCVCETLGDTLIAAVADGAGSAEKAHVGAAIACDTFIEMGVQIFVGAIEPTCLLEAIRAKIPEGETDAHAATLVGVVADSKQALILQVGDGAAVIRGQGAGDRGPEGTSSATSRAAQSAPILGAHSIPYEVALWPEETEFLNNTYFATALDAEEHLHLRRIEEPVYEIAIFSDGLQHLILDPKTKTPHQPFFQTIFKPLANEPGHEVKASWWLERQLGSDQVTKRTDDDTSIVIARRVG